VPGNGPGDDLRDCFGGIYVGLMILMVGFAGGLMVGFAGGFCWVLSDNFGYFDITRNQRDVVSRKHTENYFSSRNDLLW
jgi:hypothetical protein